MLFPGAMFSVQRAYWGVWKFGKEKGIWNSPSESGCKRLVHADVLFCHFQFHTGILRDKGLAAGLALQFFWPTGDATAICSLATRSREREKRD